MRVGSCNNTSSELEAAEIWELGHSQKYQKAEVTHLVYAPIPAGEVGRPQMGCPQPKVESTRQPEFPGPHAPKTYWAPGRSPPFPVRDQLGILSCLYLYKTSHQPLCKLQKKAISQIKPDLETTLRFYFESQKFWSSWTSKNKAAYMSAYKARFNMIPVNVQRMFTC